MSITRCTLMCLLCLMLSRVVISAQTTYTVTDLGTDIVPFNMTADGMVCGHTSGAETRPAVLVNGQFLTLPVFGFAHACNDDGEVVGEADSPNPDGVQAFLWDTNGLHWLTGPQGETNSTATGINAAGEISVHYYTPLPNGNVRRASARIEGNTWVLLPSFTGSHYFDRAQGINESGDVVMDSEGIDGWYATIATIEGGLINLGNMGSPSVRSINNAQQVTGNSSQQAFLAQPGQALKVMAPVSGFPRSLATDIDEDGSVVGMSIDNFTVNPMSPVATLWAQGQSPINLNTTIDPASGWTLTSAVTIRNGRIVGRGLFNGQSRTYLLIPQPQTPIGEPMIEVLLNQSDFAPGQTLDMDVAMHNPGPLLTTDAYVGVILPDGQTVLWLTNTSPLEWVETQIDANPSTFVPMLRNVSWPADLNVVQQDYLIYTWTGGEAPGTYHLLVGWTTPGSLLDGSIDDGDVLALGWKAVRFIGQGNTLAARE